MPYHRFVEIGRVAMINYGPDAGRLCTILDVVDQGRALVDGPYGVTGVNRQVINFRRLSLTDFTVSVPRHARQKTLKKALEKESVMSKWEQTAWAKRAAKQQKRSQLTDFDRFKVMIARKQKSAIVRNYFQRMPKSVREAVNKKRQ